MEFVNKMVKDNTKGEIRNFLDTLEAEVRGKGSAQGLSREDLWALIEILKAKKYLGDRGASSKILLEHIALVTPIKFV